MIRTYIKILQKPPGAAAINKQLDFGTAVGLTRNAKRGQTAVLGALRGNFTLRGSWFNPSNKFGIKIKPATKTDLVAAVQTNADWLIPHEEGTDKRPTKGQNIAVPTDQVRRNKRLIIPRGQRPKGLNTKAFVMQTKHGPVLAQRITRGPRKGIIVLYGLERSVHIKKVSTFYEPIQNQVKRFLGHDISEGIEFALKTAK
jgi:hypothetical protein